MPTLEALEQFKEHTNQLGNEPEILAERGEHIEDLSPPESDVDEDLEGMLGDVDSDAEEDLQVDEDLNELLSGFGEEEEAEEEEEEEPVPPAEETEEGEEDISLDEDLSLPEDEDFEMPDILEGAEGPGEEPSEEPSAEETETPEEAEASPEEEGFPEETLFEEEPEEEISLEEGPEEFEPEAEIPEEEPEPEVPETDRGLSADVDLEALERELGMVEEPEKEEGELEEEPEEPEEPEELGELGEEAAEGEISEEGVSEEPAEETDEFSMPDFEEEEEPSEAFGEETDFDIDSDLRELDEEFSAGEEVTEEGEAPREEEEVPAEDVGDFEDFGEAEEAEDFEMPEGIEELEETEGPEEEGEPAEEEPTEEEPADFEDEDEFGMPDIEEEFGDFEMPEEDLGEEPEEPAEEAEAPIEEEEAAEEGEGLPEDFEDFSEAEELEGTTEDLGEEPEEFGEAEEPVEEEEVPDFDMGEFEESDLETPEVPEEEEITADEELTGEEGAEDEEFGDEEFSGDFEIPDDLTTGDELGEEEDFSVDEFKLGDLGEHFGIAEEEEDAVPSEEELNPATAVTGDLAEAEGSEAGVSLSDEDFAAVQQTLGMMPRNLKIETESLIGEKDISPEELQRVLNLLVQGAPPKTLAAVVGKITGKKIEIPAQYEKKTGAAFEEEKDSLAYFFVNTVLPVLRVVVAAGVLLGLLIFLGHRFIYTPLRAQSLYKKGYEKLQEDEYAAGNEYFDRAAELNRKKSWYYRYAEGFIDKKQFRLAEEKYEHLLNHYEYDKKGTLDYAHLESEVLHNYPKAEQILKRYLSADETKDRDYDALLALGDNYLAWADEDTAKFEDARNSYANLIQEYGERDELLFRMMRYFIRSDLVEGRQNWNEVDKLRQYFQSDPNAEIETDAYAELGGYILAKGKIENVREVLYRAMDTDETVPEIHYHLAEYFKRTNQPLRQRNALEDALYYFEEAKPLNRRELTNYIDTYNDLGKLLYKEGEHLDAEEQLLRAKELYEDARERNVLGKKKQFGEIYYNLGNIYYYVSNNYDAAYALFEEAEDNLFSNDDLAYKKGFIQYDRENYEDALINFYKAAGSFSANNNLMYATANTLYKRKAYFSAQGYYNHLLDRLESRLESLPYLLVDEKEEHLGLVEFLMKTYNNLGVTLNRLHNQKRDPQKYSTSLGYLARSTEYFDILHRDPNTMERTQAKDLAYLNMREILYPNEYALQLYNRLPKDMEDQLF
jgi:tetratricopeptide (TPR) repeat protein